MDYGETGLYSTLKACKKNNIKTVGAGTTLAQVRKTFYYDKYGTRVAVINIAENEFGTTNGKQIGAHSLDIAQNFYRIQEAKKKADKVILIIHGGHEYYQLPSPRMKTTYRYFVDVGADAIIGHHSHCYSGYEIYNNTPIFYGLGNFLFDKNGKKKNDSWNIGFMVRLLIDNKSDISFEILPYCQNKEQAGLRKLNDSENVHFRKEMNKLNDIISDDSKVEEHFEDYCKKTYKLYSSYIEPYSNDFLHALRNRNLFPSLLTKRKKRLLLNLTRCESHRDVLIKLLDYENSHSSKGK
jgi:poly-gamma-glutamate synthesis protein (capsule biosynthesis protein)